MNRELIQQQAEELLVVNQDVGSLGLGMGGII